MILSIETSNDELVKAIKAIAKVGQAKISITKEKKKPSKRLLEALSEAKKMRLDDKEYPAFTSIEALKKSLEA